MIFKDFESPYSISKEDFVPAKNYSGQAIHILRNNKWFYITDLFYSFSSLTFSTSIKRISSSDSTKVVYGDGNVEVEICNGTSTTPHRVGIKANTYSSGVEIKSIVINVDQGSSRNFSINVFIHSSISQLWLGPEKITLHKDLVGNTISGRTIYKVFAKFNTGIIAEISQPLYENLALKWEFKLVGGTSYSNTLSIESQTLEIHIDDGDIGLGGNAFLEATTLPINLKVRATILSTSFFYLSSGSTLEAVGDLEITNSNGSICLVHGTTSIEDKNNFLILGDGFASTELSVFERYAEQIAAQLNYSRLTSPWNLFESQNNFFSYLLPSEDNVNYAKGEHLVLTKGSKKYATILSRYISFCNQIIDEMNNKYYKISNTYNDAANSKVYLGLDNFEETLGSLYNLYPINYDLLEDIQYNYISPFRPDHMPPDLIEEVKLNWLIEIVGMPTPADAFAFVDKASELVYFKNKVKEWRYVENVYDSSFNFISGSSPKYQIVDDVSTISNMNIPKLSLFVFYMWRIMGNYTYLTPPNTSFRCYTYGQNWLNDSSINMEVPKGSFNHFISNIKYSNENLGVASSSPLNLGSKFFFIDGSGFITKGKDANNIILLSKTRPLNVSGNNLISEQGNLSFVDINCETEKVLNELKNSVTLPIYQIADIKPSQLRFKALNTAIHELNHNYLGDEYAISFGVYSNSVALDNANELSWNLQGERYLRADANDPVPNERIDPNNTRWNWPRIKKIALLKKYLLIDDIDAGTDTYRFKIEGASPNMASASNECFSENEVVLLRKRNFSNVSFYLKCEITDINFTVSPIEIDIKCIDTVNSFVKDDYVDGSVLILPHWNAEKTAYKKVIHEKVMLGMNNASGTMIPLVAEDDNIVGEHIAQQPIKSIADLFKTPTHKEKIIGLYAGGSHGAKGYHKGLYHPSGFCIMRSTNNNQPSASKKGYTANSFCQVCKYILAEKINPLVHPQLDLDYESDYPVEK